MKYIRPAFPQLTRRDFFRVGAVTVGGYSLVPWVKPLNVETKRKVGPRGTAEFCIFYFLLGGMSQPDTFDLKEGPWTPEDLDIRKIHAELKLPFGLYPHLSKRMDKIALIRSMEAWENVHERGQYYIQVGHPFSPARFQEMPNVGSVIAYEWEARRQDSDYLPPFMALNFSTNLVGSGSLPATFAPMSADTKGSKPFLMEEEERPRHMLRRELLERLDPAREGPSGRGRILHDYTNYYQGAYRLLDAPDASEIFEISEEDHQRYGQTSSGDACVVARNLVEANAGTRFICIGQGGWDLHGDAWKKNAKVNQYTCCTEMDGALATLLDDLESTRSEDGRSLLEKTLVVCMGEFGRTPGELNPRHGRDHHRYAHTGLFAGAGVVGGKIMGATDEIGNRVTRADWHAGRSVYPEDVMATIYSAMGIDWTKQITDTPSGRPFYYIEDISPLGMMRFDDIRELFS